MCVYTSNFQQVCIFKVAGSEVAVMKTEASQRLLERDTDCYCPPSTHTRTLSSMFADYCT